MKFNLYQRITDAIKLRNKDGMIIGPTGVGKGEIIQQLINKLFKKKSPSLSIIVTHRILLSMELAERVVKGTTDKWPNISNRPGYDRVSVHSGNAQEFSSDKALDKMWMNSYQDTSARSAPHLVEIIKEGLSRGSSQLISTTYHSLPKVNAALKELDIDVDLVQFDEIQNLNNDVWLKSVKEIKSRSNKTRSYTATLTKKMKHRLEHVLGKVIWYMEPKEAIDIGLITQPKWVTAEVNGDKENYLDQGVQEFFNKIQSKLTLPLKLLVHCNRTWELRVLTDKKNRIWSELKKQYPDLMIAAISSHKDIGHYINGKMYKDRMEWLRSIKEHNGRLIAVHVDILNSGIDVPGFQSSCWTSPPSSESRLVQGNGRSKRLHPQDRINLEDQQITTKDRSTWIKPFNYEGVLWFKDAVDSDINRFVDTVIKSRDEGFIPEDVDYDNENGSNKKGEPGDDITPLQSKIRARMKFKIEQNKKLQAQQKLKGTPTSELIKQLATETLNQKELV